ncbi:hypothetical protein TNCV_899281 [Trichonephila clavipes]|nr:hypothetical protein TNCV_899281 [Trichonephila clavipes]
MKKVAETFVIHLTTVKRRPVNLGFTKNCIVGFHITRQLSNGMTESSTVFLCFPGKKWRILGTNCNRNVRSRRTVRPPSDPSASTSKESFIESVMECVGHNSLAGSATQPNCLFCLLLFTVRSCIQIWQQSGQVSSIVGGVFFHHDNARPHAAVISRQKLMGFSVGRFYPLPLFF